MPHVTSIQPFRISIPADEVDRLKRKLADTRVPQEDIVPGAADHYGPPGDWFRRLMNKWQSNFDWATVEKHLNRYDHFIAHVHDEVRSVELDIHYVHIKSKASNAIPLVLVHGWPGSFYEFDRVVEQLANPPAGSSEPSFDLVVPSLPGFCWSSNPPCRGWSLADSARIFDALMQSLGYKSYGAQAGDWGSFVARALGAKHNACKAVHLNFSPPDGNFEEDPQDTASNLRLVRSQAWLDDHLGYAVCMRTRPQTIGFALTDNPMGILAWVGEKYHELAAPERMSDPEWDEAILVQVSLYYFSNCIMPSTLVYYENPKHADFATYFQREENKVKVPLGYTSFLYDSRPGTKNSAKTTGNLVFYNHYDDGGHFAALECPDVIAADCREFFGNFFKP